MGPLRKESKCVANGKDKCAVGLGIGYPKVNREYVF